MSVLLLGLDLVYTELVYWNLRKGEYKDERGWGIGFFFLILYVVYFSLINR